jgi:F-type H+-transporting ATPase subunit c
MTTLLILAELGLEKMSAGFGAGIAAFAAAYGISRIGQSAMEALARQPEASSDIRSNMILASAFIEGVAFLAVIVCVLLAVL